MNGSEGIYSDLLDEVLERVFIMENPPVEPEWFTSRDYMEKLKQKGIVITDIGGISKRLTALANQGKLIRHQIGRSVYFELPKEQDEDA